MARHNLIGTILKGQKENHMDECNQYVRMYVRLLKFVHALHLQSKNMHTCVYHMLMPPTNIY